MDLFTYGMNGAGIVVQSPDEVSSVIRKGDGAHITGIPAREPGFVSWFHFPITTLMFIGDGKCPTVKKINILFETGGTAKITSVHAWLGWNNKIWAMDNLTIAGSHLNPDHDNGFTGPQFDPHMPVNVCVGVHFGPLEGAIHPTIWFHGVILVCDLD